MKHRSIAIDGPSGAGKSTLAKMLSEALGFLYVDTGAIYRTVGLNVFREGVSPEDTQRVIPMLEGIHIDLRHGEDGLQHMYLDGEDVTDEIRRPEISQYASAVSAIPQVRTFLMEMQRDLARRYDVIMDGRDIGTVVLPQADVKIFLTAGSEARARRRHAELLERGLESDYQSVLSELRIRDRRDSGRAVAPLRQAEGAVRIDTTDYSLEESFQVLLKTIKERLER